jgi:hypothetical protein
MFEASSTMGQLFQASFDFLLHSVDEPVDEAGKNGFLNKERKIIHDEDVEHESAQLWA